MPLKFGFMAQLAYRRLRAPTEDGTALIDPPLSEFDELIARNRQQASTRKFSILGVPLPTLATAARAEFLNAAIDYTRQERDTSWVPEGAPQSPLLLGGHQPELFHPGVWFKNFLLSSAA